MSQDYDSGMQSKAIEASFIITFSNRSGNTIHQKKIFEYVLNQLKANEMIINEQLQLDDGTLVVELSCTRTKIEELAEKEDFTKMSKKGKMEYFVRKNASSHFSNYDTSNFFLPSEESYLLFSVIQNIKIFPHFNNLLQNRQQKVNEGESLLYSCMRMGFISDIQAKHLPLRRKIWRESISFVPVSEKLVKDIYAYYGSQVAFYFAWLNHFTMWLIAPGIFGAIVTIHDYISIKEEAAIDKSELAPFFTLFIIIWSVLFIQYWKRRSAALSCEWGTLTFPVKKDVQHIRAEFRGELRECPITSKPVRYFSRANRLIRYFFSAIVTSIMLTIAFFVMVMSLNFQGYIHTTSVGGSYIHFPTLHQFSVPGAIFDQLGGGPLPYLLPYVPTITHSIVIMQLNRIYRDIASKLTNWENHKTQQGHENALVIKRFFFEAFDCYIGLFYLAFCQVDIVLLKQELVSLYTVDSIRRVSTESILPLAMQLVNKNVQIQDIAHAKRNDDYESSNKSPIVQELLLDEYELFDDYLEMVIQFGYIILFASAFPLASTLSILCNLVEMQSDIFKLSFVMKRPKPERTTSIGIWLYLLTGMVWLAMLTNVFIFGFTTEQMMQIFPSMFRVEASNDSTFGGSDHTHIARLGMGRYVVAIVFFIEHLFMLIASIIFRAIPDVPEGVSNELLRRDYNRSKSSLKCTQ